MERNSSRKVRVAISARAPASSTPVAPAPTIVNVSQAQRCSRFFARSAASNAYRILWWIAVSSSKPLEARNPLASLLPTYDDCDPVATISESHSMRSPSPSSCSACGVEIDGFAQEHAL